MTCVVAISDGDGFVVGGDSFVGDGRIYHRVHEPKFFREGNVVFGLCGYTIYENVFRAQAKSIFAEASGDMVQVLSNEFLPKVKSILQEEDLLVTEDGSIPEMKDSSYFAILNLDPGYAFYYIDEDLSYWRAGDPYIAIGSGAVPALASFHTSYALGVPPLRATSLALETASNLTPWVCPPFHVQQVRF